MLKFARIFKCVCASLFFLFFICYFDVNIVVYLIILCYNIMCTVSFEFSAAVVGNSFHYYYSKYIKRYICILKFNRFHHLNLGSNQLILYTLITETNPLKGVSRNSIMKYSYIIPVSCDSLELLVCIQM